MHIQTLPVYSKVADEVPEELKATLPQGWRLSQHQVETYCALTDPQGPDVVINTAMTGDGKSLAGQLPALVKNSFHAPRGMHCWALRALDPGAWKSQPSTPSVERELPQFSAEAVCENENVER
ncbi:MAG: hypothetical protein R3C14_38600 [Caldilineaceae bacterium]